MNARLFAGPFVGEEFATDPVASNRFAQETFGTESSFTYIANNQNLTAVLDVDYDDAYYLSAPFPPISILEDASFSFNFRITALDNRVLPTAYIGLLTTNHVALGGDGLTLALSSSTNGLPVFSAAVDQGQANSGGEAVPLSLATDYLAIGRFVSSNRQFTVEVYRDANFVNLVGRSTAYATNSPTLNLDRVGLQNGGGTSLDYTNGSITLIIDNIFLPARPPVNLSITTNVVVEEGNVGTTNAVFAVALTSPSEQTVRVDYVTVPLTATPGVDFLPRSGTLVFPPGSNSLTLTVPILGDLLAEPDETFKVVLTNVVNANLIASEGLGTIQNDDICRISINDTTVTETAGSTSAVFTVSLNLTNSQTVTVQFATANSSATSGSDYVATNGLLTFPPGTMTQICSVTVLDDNLDEPDESFSVALANPVNANFLKQIGTGTIIDDDPPAINIGGTLRSEGDSNTTAFIFPVTLTSSSTNAITVSFATADGTATAGVDFLGTNAVLTFPPGVVSNSITVFVFGDTLYEPHERFYVNLNSPTNATLETAQAIGLILNDDLPPFVYLTNISLVEGTCTNIQVTLSYTSSLPVILQYCISNLPANVFLVCDTNCNVLVPTNVPPSCRTLCCQLIIPPGGLSTNFQICAEHNPEDELDQNGRGTGEPLGGSGRDVVTHQIHYHDIDPPIIRGANSGVVEGNSGLTNVCFALGLSKPSGTNVFVNYFTVDGSATAGSDYLATNGTVVFPPGGTNMTICIRVVGDTIYEAHETFRVALTNAINGVIPNALITGLIINDDLAPALTISDVFVVEGNSGVTQAVFTVTVPSPTELGIGLAFTTVDVTATSGSDYTPTNGNLYFDPAVTNLTIAVSILGDTLDEPNETFLIRLSDPINATLAKTSGIGTIIDDDPPEIRVSNPAVAEGNSGTTNLSFVVTLSTSDSNLVTVGFLTAPGTATPEADYVSTNGLLAFQPGETNKTVLTQVIGDTLIESSETLFLYLTNAVNGTLPLPGGTGTIVDDDAPCISIANVLVRERTGGPTNAVFLVTLDKPSSLPLSVSYATANGSAVAGSDYIVQSGTLIFSNGTTNQSLSILINNDLEVETNETFFVDLSNPVNVNLCSARGTATILDGTVPPVITISNAVVVEGGGGTTNALFVVALDRPSPGQTVAFDFATGADTAAAGVDFVATTQTVTFLPGTVSNYFFVPVTGDCSFEPDEAFLVNLSNPRFAVLATNQVRGVILNDDSPPAILIDDVSILEGDFGTTNAVFVVRLSCPSSFPASVNYAITDGTATAGIDYVATNGILNFAAGQTNLTLTVPVFGDRDGELNEVFYVLLSAPVGASLSTNRAVGTIINDDPPCIFIRDTTVTEDGTGSQSARSLVTLSQTSSLPICVNWFTTNGLAIAGPDYIASSGVVCFPPGTTNAEILVGTLANTRDETNEFFYVVLQDPTNATLCKPRGVSTIINPLVSNVPPVVTLTAPAGGSCLTAPTNLTLSAQANDVDGRINRVEFFNNTNKLGESFDPPFQTTWLNVPPGHHLLTAVALDNVGASTTSAPVAFSASLPATLTINDRSAVEGNAGFTDLVFTVTLSSPSCRTVTVQVVSVPGTAQPGSDYQSVATTLSFNPDETQRTLAVPVFGDTAIESNESFSIILTNEVNAAVSKRIGIGTILNDDTNLKPTVKIVSPVSNAVFYVPPGIIPVLADAQDLDGFVREVEFYAGTALVGRSTNSPFGIQWTNGLAGSYDLTAVAIDNDLARATSSPVSVLVTGCSGILTATPLTSQTACDCGAVTFSTSVTSPDPVTFLWRLNGRLIPAQTSNSLTVQGLSSGLAGLYSVEVYSPCQAVTNSALLGVQGEIMPNPALFANPGRIIINDASPATPYPSPILVQCVPGRITKLSVTLSRLYHDFPGDVDVLLVNPEGKALKLISDVGENGGAITNLTLTLEDSATSPMPENTPFDSGSYRPTDYLGGDNDNFAGSPSLPPSLTYVTNLAALNSPAPNGTWNLCVMDDANLDAGAVEGGWSMMIWYDDAPPRLTSPAVLGDGRFQMTLTSQAGRTHAIEASTDLNHWFTVTNFVMVGPSMQIILPNAENGVYGFYRVHRCPAVDLFEGNPARLTSP